ncbi:MAG: 30S ribosomal protein S11 [Deltaproteobacteria bacterium RIFCSPLOWO2_01_44_7]|nr:MAG: 30S ribosomal protein S11 [Deltaproteobacteria bacterium RIFCSPHIGHO2_01_FULL_43_49]OGQ14950.1 MAG: 30S ribosomal protein S11 [Deltaproteobacteria bacterium RIFCSPHIGHO2_02_FULL_44_53]OGQ29547.1 MAG: 30S ribosomal protein S11 [Deltaproteobacteria bacterium RIFCSPHIGHO2_12_FULL_44_21]OGQ31062.1 MAG: 30S ribosomal protein S11 [Deltaproteobacteria bacterium RIFCSPLOWO2_01_FULL_45_74]OGQ41196.1 MAG: 30S ribosomal protein S11 [Deltaproteobacteria bacterium RIFCSPLOWO2_01_44_7]OGQ42664.1 MAG
MAEEKEKTHQTAPIKPVKKGKKKVRKHVPIAIVHIQSSFNNTIITVTDLQGNTLSWSSGGVKGFKGSRKGTPFAAQLACEDAVRKAMDHGVKQVVVYVKGPGVGRDSALRILQKTGVRVTGIRDVTPIPHNGCRPPKKRRV